MEIWDVYDEKRAKTGRTMVRGEAVAEGDYHLVVHVCIFNSKGEMLLQKRQAFKKGWPGMWDLTVGGAAIAGDDSNKAAERELFEEIGYAADLSKMRPHLTVNFDTGFDDIYLMTADVDIDSLQLQYEEVEQVKWATKEEINEMLKSGQFVPYHQSLINLLFEMRNHFGAIIKD